MKTKLLIIIAFLIVILTIILCMKPLFKINDNNVENNSINNNNIVQEIEPEKAEEIYDQLTENCSGALIWNLEPGEKIEITNTSITEACKNENYYSKTIGYTYNDIGVVLHINVLKKIENNLYKLDETYVGKYETNNLENLLDHGTTYEYTFVKKDDNYELKNVSLM